MVGRGPARTGIRVRTEIAAAGTRTHGDRYGGGRVHTEIAEEDEDTEERHICDGTAPCPHPAR